MVKWDEKYRKQGLVVLEVDNGSIDELAALEKHLKKKKVSFPVLWDKDGKTCDAYEAKYPGAVLIGPDGKVLWRGVPLLKPIEDQYPEEQTVDQLTKRIESALKKVDLKALQKKGDVFLRTKPGELPADVSPPGDGKPRSDRSGS